MENNIKNMPETTLQKEIHLFISEPSKIFQTVNGRRLQIISPGRINVHEGPDLMDIAILLDGYLIIGDAEIHKKSSDWISHNHDSDINFKKVILHIVLDNDNQLSNKFETLVLDSKDIAKSKKNISNENSSFFSLEEVQNLALHRLLRKTSDAKKILISNDLKTTLIQMTGNYIDRYSSKKNRHKYSPNDLSELVSGVSESYAYELLLQIQNGSEVVIQDAMIRLLKKKLAGEGAHLRRELVINSILPIAFALAGDEIRINLFVWYWSTPSLNEYGMLKRKFPDIPQNYLWQQQGMLEYIREYGNQNNVASEALREYGFAEILSFYRLGRLPLEIETNNQI